MASIMYTPKDIFEQEFKTSMRGYDKKEVDEFLDDVIKDYESYMTLVEELKAENQRLKSKLNNVKSTPTVAPSAGRAETESTSNYDLLKRISRLEKEVFGKQLSKSK